MNYVGGHKLQAAVGEASAHSLTVMRPNLAAYEVIALWREKEGYAERRTAWLQRFASGTLLVV